MGLRGVWGVAWEGWWPALAGWVVGPGDISRGCAKMGLHPTTPIVFNGARSSLGELVLGGVYRNSVLCSGLGQGPHWDSWYGVGVGLG